MTNHLVVTFHPHWRNGWRLRQNAAPYVEIDGHERECSWHEPTHVPLAAGTYTVRTFWRDRASITADEGAGQGAFTLNTGVDTFVDTYNRAPSGSPFVPRLGV